MGFEPTRAEHIGLAVQRLNHSATSSTVSSASTFVQSDSVVIDKSSFILRKQVELQSDKSQIAGGVKYFNSSLQQIPFASSNIFVSLSNQLKTLPTDTVKLYFVMEKSMKYILIR